MNPCPHPGRRSPVRQERPLGAPVSRPESALTSSRPYDGGTRPIPRQTEGRNRHGWKNEKNTGSWTHQLFAAEEVRCLWPCSRCVSELRIWEPAHQTTGPTPPSPWPPSPGGRSPVDHTAELKIHFALDIQLIKSIFVSVSHAVIKLSSYITRAACGDVKNASKQK